MRLVVIGGVAAGLSAAARARRLDPSLDILVLEKSDSISYSSCGLPYFVEGRVSPLDRLVRYTAAAFARERNVAVHTGAEVVAIRHPERAVVLRDGERVRYDRLVIATGARVDRSRIAGADRPHVFALHTLSDAARLRQQMASAAGKRAVIVGGGYIGLECAEALRANGLDVTVLQATPFLLSREDPALTSLLVKHLEEFRVEVRLSTRATTIAEGNVSGSPCDLVVLASGYTPNVDLAASAGVELGRTGAIRTSETMETSLPGVFAAGDCAETIHLVTGRPLWLPLGTTANKMGRVAGASAAGRRARFAGVVGTTCVRVCGLGVAVTGLSCAQARTEGFDAVATTIEAKDRPGYFGGRPTRVELVADRRTRRLLGASVTGEEGVAGRINVVAAALHNRMRVDEFADLDLAYAPPFAPVWDPLLIAAQQLIKLLD